MVRDLQLAARVLRIERPSPTDPQLRVPPPPPVAEVAQALLSPGGIARAVGEALGTSIEQQKHRLEHVVQALGQGRSAERCREHVQAVLQAQMPTLTLDAPKALAGIWFDFSKHEKVDARRDLK